MNLFRNFFMVSIAILFAFPAAAIPSLTIYLFDNKLCQCYGKEPATASYQDKIHEFLQYLDVPGAGQVLVRALQPQDSASAILPGLTGLTGIWINERLLNAESEEERLWVLAHEAAHYKLRHSFYIYGARLISLIVSSLPTACYNALFLWQTYNNRQLYEKPVIEIVRGTMLGLAGGMAVISLYRNTDKIQNDYAKSCEREADLTAARILCSNGYEYVVQHHINLLRTCIEKNYVLINYKDHPTFEQALAYMETFWNTWNNKKAA